MIEERTKNGEHEHQTTQPPSNLPTSNFEAELTTSLNTRAPYFTNGAMNENAQSSPAPENNHPLDSDARTESTPILPPLMAPVSPLVPGPQSHTLGNHNTSPYAEPGARLLSSSPTGMNTNSFSSAETRTPILFPGAPPLGFLGHNQRGPSAGYAFGQTFAYHQTAAQSRGTSQYSSNNQFTQSFPNDQHIFHQQSPPYQSAISYSTHQYQETLQPQPNPHAQQNPPGYFFDNTANYTGTTLPESYNNPRNPAGYQTSPGHNNNGGRLAPSASSHTQQGWSGQGKWTGDGGYST